MKATRYGSYLASILMSALIGAFSGTALAGQVGPLSTSPYNVIAFGQEIMQTGDQDPNSPPDCKKYPRDTRCQGKK